MKEPIAWKDRNKSQAVLHCSSCYLLWYGVVGCVRGDDEQPGLPAALRSRAGGACHAAGLLFSSLPALPPSILASSLSSPNCLPTQSPLKPLSAWLESSGRKGKSPQGSQGAARAGPFSTGRCGNGWRVSCRPSRRVQGAGALLGRGLSTARVWWRMRELCYAILKAF